MNARDDVSPCLRESSAGGAPPLCVVLRCADAAVPKARYVFDTLLMAAGIQVRFVAEPPSDGPWLLYAASKHAEPAAAARCLAVAHCPQAWQIYAGREDATEAAEVDGLAAVLPQRASNFDADTDIAFDIVANAFYFLSSWSERLQSGGSRRLHGDSAQARRGIAQDIVDRYLDRLTACLRRVAQRLGMQPWPAQTWPGGAAYALVLTHDVDFLPSGPADIARQGAKTLLRHLVRQRDPFDALRAMAGLTRACLRGRDPYGCVPQIIEREVHMGVRSSFQVAVASRHPHDVNYRIEDDRVRDYLRVIIDAGFDLCLHGSYRSTERAQWYCDEVALLTRRLARPIGSRQHFLSFDFDTLFAAQERSGIQYDMSMGFPDRIGPRNGFSYPYFPYSLEHDRPFDVLQIGLGLMDVTLRSYMGLRPAPARRVVDDLLDGLARKRGCLSMVWHPIVFAGARDPGYDDLYWHIVERVGASGGIATDGRTINAHWRERARSYASFAAMQEGAGPALPMPRAPAAQQATAVSC